MQLLAKLLRFRAENSIAQYLLGRWSQFGLFSQNASYYALELFAVKVQFNVVYRIYIARANFDR
jgi:hypothetical protein